MNKKICMLTTTNLDYDTRILNEAEALSEDYEVVILTPGFNNKVDNLPFKVKVRHSTNLRFLPKTIVIILNLLILIKAAFKEKTDIFHAHDLTGLFCVFWPAIFKRKIVIYDSHELWTGISLNGWMKIYRYPFIILEKIMITKVSKIITVNDSIAEILKNKYKKPVLACHNYPKIMLPCRNQNQQNNNKTILYLGAFLKGRGLEKIISVCNKLDDTYKVLFVGFGPLKNELEREIKRKNLDKKISILPPISPAKITNFTSQVKLGICLIENKSKSYYLSTPNKLFQYIGAEIPVLASDFPELKKIVVNNEIGEVIDPQNIDGIVQKIKIMSTPNNQKKYRQNLKGLSKRKYNWQNEARALRLYYRDIAN